MEQIKKDWSQEKITEWVDTFLRGVGRNVALADALKETKKYWINLPKFPLDELIRCMGPEKNMEYVESEEKWNSRIDSLVAHIKSGAQIPPLIACYMNGIFSVRDGNHRYGACEKMGEISHHTLIWCDTEEDFKKVRQLVGQ